MLGFGSRMQEFRADHSPEKRVQFSAFVKMSAHRIGRACGCRGRPGDHPSCRNASGIFFGVLLAGSGSVWTNNAKFEVVGPTVLTTDGDVHLKPDEPMNLDLRSEQKSSRPSLSSQSPRLRRGLAC